MRPRISGSDSQSRRRRSASGADLKWVPEIPEADRLEYDPDLAIELLDAAGYVDTDGDGFRELPGGGENIVLRHAVNTDSDLGGAVGELFSGWMNAIGIQVELDSYDQDQLFGVIVDGTYDTFYWGWVPFVDPDPMLSYFTEAELGNYNDANWSDPKFEELYLAQKQEVDPDARLDIVHEAVKLIYDNAAYIAMWYSPDLQAYRTDKFEGYVRQPADIGPVIFSQSSPSYALLRPIGADVPVEATGDQTAEDTTDGSPTEPTDRPTPGRPTSRPTPGRPTSRPTSRPTAPMRLPLTRVMTTTAATARRSRSSSSSRSPCSASAASRSHAAGSRSTNGSSTTMSARFVLKKIAGSFLTLAFVLVFNFFLFRVVQADPVGTLFRGRNVPQARLDQMRVDFGLEDSLAKQFVLYLRETAQLNFGFSYQSRQPVWDEIISKIWPTILLVGVAALFSAVFGIAGGFIAAWRRGSASDYSITTSTMIFYSMPDFWLGMLLLVGFAVVLPGSRSAA